MLTQDILFGMNILTLAGFAVMGLTLTLNRMGQAGKLLSIGLMAAGTALVFVGLYRTHKREPRRGKDAGAQERAAADGRSVSGRPCEWNSSAAPVCSLASSMATKCELFHIGRLFLPPSVHRCNRAARELDGA